MSWPSCINIFLTTPTWFVRKLFRSVSPSSWYRRTTAVLLTRVPSFTRHFISVAFLSTVGSFTEIVSGPVSINLFQSKTITITEYMLMMCWFEQEEKYTPTKKVNTIEFDNLKRVINYRNRDEFAIRENDNCTTVEPTSRNNYKRLRGMKKFKNLTVTLRKRFEFSISMGEFTGDSGTSLCM